MQVTKQLDKPKILYSLIRSHKSSCIILHDTSSSKSSVCWQLTRWKYWESCLIDVWPSANTWRQWCDRASITHKPSNTYDTCLSWSSHKC